MTLTITLRESSRYLWLLKEVKETTWLLRNYMKFNFFYSRPYTARQSITKCWPVCPIPMPPGWADVYIIHIIGHMILTQAELLAAKIGYAMCHNRFLWQVRLKLEWSFQHFVNECREVSEIFPEFNSWSYDPFTLNLWPGTAHYDQNPPNDWSYINTHQIYT
jgi:hypothetical protein